MIYKSTTVAPFCHSYLNPLTFTSFLYKSQEWKSWKFFSRKKQVSSKNQKNKKPVQEIEVFKSFLCLKMNIMQNISYELKEIIKYETRNVTVKFWSTQLNHTHVI